MGEHSRKGHSIWEENATGGARWWQKSYGELFPALLAEMGCSQLVHLLFTTSDRLSFHCKDITTQHMKRLKQQK